MLAASLAWAQNGNNPAFDSVTFPVFTLNPAPVSGASIDIVGAPGQATWYFWASANYQLGSVVSSLGSISNAPNTLTSGNYVSIIPDSYPAGVLTVDILATTGPLAPVGACNCAIATGLTSGGVSFQSNSLSSYTVSILNPQAFNLRLTNEVTGTGATSLVLRNALTGALVCNLSTGCGSGSTSPAGSNQLQASNSGGTAFVAVTNVVPGSLLASTGTTTPPAPQTKPVFDVRDQGAVGNGSTDDRVAINAALTACANTGGTVILPPTSASYYVSNSIAAVSNCTLDGQGGAKITIPSAGWALVAHTGFGIINVYNVSNFAVRGLHIVGTESAAQGVTPKLIYVDTVSGLDINHNFLEHSSYEGIWVGGSISNLNDMSVTENRFDDIAYSPGLQALYLGGTRAVAGNNRFRHVGVGIGMSGCTKCSATGNVIDDPSNAGISVGDGGSDGPISISGNTVNITNLNGGSSQRGFYDEGSASGYVNYAVNWAGNTCKIDGVVGYRPAICFNGQVPNWTGSNGMSSWNGNTAQITVAGNGYTWTLPIGTPVSGSVIANSNTVEVINDGGTPGDASGFVAIPNGAGNTLTIHSSGNKALGFTRANSEYGINYNQSGGGTINAYVNNDLVDGGYVGIGNAVSDYNTAGELDSNPIFANAVAGIGTLGNSLLPYLNVPWSGLQAPTANLSLGLGSYATTFTSTGDPGGSTHTSWEQILPALAGSPIASQMVFQDTTGNTSTGTMLTIRTVGTSTANPLSVLTGAGNGFTVFASGLVQATGTGGDIRASSIANGAVFIDTVSGNPFFTGTVSIEKPFNCGSTGTASCVMTANGITSGSATLTWPDVASTISNPLVSSNNFSAPAFVSTVTTGTAPLSVASATNVPNLNASSLNGATFANPGPIGTTPSTGAFTTLSVSTSVKIVNATYTSTAGVPSANCAVGDLDTNTSASSASTVLYVCYPVNTWNAVTVP